MVQNTLGKLWLRNKPGSGLKALMPYYLESPSETTDTYLKLTSPQELTLLDPAAGSGHILVYAFELLAHIYEEEGYSRTDIPSLILQHNLMGFDIDERAAQLASFTLTMKARQYDRRFFRRNVQPRVVALHKLEHTTPADWQPVLADADVALTDTLRADLTLMTQADNLGALIRPETGDATLQQAADTLNTYARQSSDLFRKPLAEDLSKALEHLMLLAYKRTCVVANPPYMGGGAMNATLSTFVKKYYPDSKADLMACFMERGLSLCQPSGYLSMINQHSWMFLGSYEDLRKKLIDTILIDTLLHLGPRTFPEIGGEVVQNAAFTFQNQTYAEPPAGHYVRLVDLKNTTEKAANVTNAALTYHARQDNFEKIPGEVIGYWLSDRVLNIFIDEDSLKEHLQSSVGMQTGNNNEFLRSWNEVSYSKINTSAASGHDFKVKKWAPCHKVEKLKNGMEITTLL
ncbi:Eco57I restriction-modification methylase domain-containing protein [Spirosoma endophyticum]|uniref:site-specific DNA-methyltransferase (adenine-specific) n=1 Tax=Spirosoma endophyticum TaxID=662367 RepID=A0A1I2GF38_9BACT|nr:N-6 DNA methylase [Spirosoma endophyticum]SFF15600.1 Methyltransferase domain-containing protein [Spirosoma endophyticum]